ncbi:MAG: LamG domain-containing protein, partial [Planctomycetota bacterium]
MHWKNLIRTTALGAAVGTTLAAAETYPWQQDYATVLPNGDLQLKQEPYRFTAGKTIRYIDYEAGDDRNPGTREAPWKHHPWDVSAGGTAKGHSGPTTYVFKGGVIYRGELTNKRDAGSAAEPIRLTRDPDWGDGPAYVYGSQAITGGWQQGGHKDMPDQDQVWHIDLDWAPRTAWVADGDDITRLKLARDPNWTVSDPMDPAAEWYAWDNPQWWKGKNKTKVKGKQMHLGIDKDQLTRPASDYVGGTVWSEWGFVMGTPYPSEIHTYDSGQKGITFHGPWTHFGSENVATNNRYFLEDKAWMLDQDGEFWFDKKGDGGRLYARMPDGSDPNSLTVEVGKVVNLIDTRRLEHVHVTGLTFRFTNQSWQYNWPQWWGQDQATGISPNRAAVIRHHGPGGDILIAHNHFEHVHMPARIKPLEGDRIGTVSVHDNVMRFTDHGALRIINEGGGGSMEAVEKELGPVDRVDVLRNDLFEIGMRGLPGGHGHGITINRPTTAHVAGNVLHRIGGWGISVTGNKGGGQLYDVPYARYLIHQNRIDSPMLYTCDWGGIETWQGGSHYVWNNVSINPGGLRYWGWKDRKDASPRFGHAYYMDGAFKNFYFNNIAIGLSNDKSTKYAAHAAFQEIIGFQNSVFNNTAYKFENASRRQAPDVGRNKYLGNIFDDMSEWVFYHAKEPKGGFDPNAHHFDQAEAFAHETNAYGGNVIHNPHEKLAVFESHGKPYTDIDELSAAMREHGSQQPGVGVLAATSPLQDPDEGDFRPKGDGPAVGMGVRTFVPWQLARTVGEWHFTRNNKDPGRIIDEAWYMQPYYHQRTMYKDTPRYPLRGSDLTADSFVPGPLESWTDGVLALEEGQVLGISHASLIAPFTTTVDIKKVVKKQEMTWAGDEKNTVDVRDQDFLIEAYLKTTDKDGTIAGKDNGVGYLLELDGGRVQLRLREGGQNALTATGPRIADGDWHHVVVELDRTAGEARIYVDGEQVQVDSAGTIPATLANEADFQVG